MKKIVLVMGLILFSVAMMAQKGLVKEFEWKSGYTAEYWVPVQVSYDYTAGTTNVTMGLYKSKIFYNSIKTDAAKRQENILARKSEFYFNSIILPANIADSVKVYRGPYFQQTPNPTPVGTQTPYVGFFDGVTIE